MRCPSPTHALLALALTVAAASAAPTAARADNDSILTLGVGAGVGWRHAAGPGDEAEMKFVNQASARLKMLWILGLDLSVDLTKDGDLTEVKDGDLRYAAKMRLTALLYPMITSSFAIYLGTGVGAADKSELFSVTSPGNSYHMGGGFEVHFDDHLTLDCSFYMIVPGYRSVKGHVQKLALSIAEEAAAGVANGQPAPQSVSDLPLPDLTVGDFITPNNYEFMVRIFVFL